MSFRTSHALGALGILCLTAAACGSRGPLDGSEAIDSLDAAPPPPVPTTTGTLSDASTKPPGPDLPPIVDCGICLVGECGQPILSCLTNAPCQQAFQCVITKCGAGLDTKCILGCAQSSPQGALQLLSIFQCVTGKCGEDCTDILSQLGGGLPGGGGGGGGGGGPPPPVPRDAGPPKALPGAPEGQKGRIALERAFSAWPELFTPAR